MQVCSLFTTYLHVKKLTSEHEDHIKLEGDPICELFGGAKVCRKDQVNQHLITLITPVGGKKKQLKYLEENLSQLGVLNSKFIALQFKILQLKENCSWC